MILRKKPVKPEKKTVDHRVYWEAITDQTIQQLKDVFDKFIAGEEKGYFSTRVDPQLWTPVNDFSKCSFEYEGGMYRGDGDEVYFCIQYIQSDYSYDIDIKQYEKKLEKWQSWYDENEDAIIAEKARRKKKK